MIASAQQRKGFDWAGFNRYEQANAEMVTEPSVVFLGDSITDLWGQNRPDFFTSHNYACRGIGAQSTANMLARFQNDVVNLHPKVVVILCGTNDVAENNGPIKLTNVVNEIKSMCEIARAHGIIPVLCSVTPCNHFFWREDMKPGETIIELNKLIRDYATAAGIVYCDYHSQMTLPDGSLPEEYSEDGCHPIDKGYEKMESIIVPVLENIFANK